ncbi:YbbR-like domain-containing protein [Peptococcus simiae]|uniref:CdaR family protein n=1 Tax=Peptococcus simiae TaxID=1643805 RepID=UPI00397F2561
MKKLEIKNPGLKVIALALAILLWFYVGIEKNPFETRFFQVPVTYEHLDGEMSVNSPTKQVSITVRARSNQFDSLTAGDFTASVNLSKVKVGDNTVPVMVKSPNHVQVTKVSPREIVVTAERLDGKRLPVQVLETGQLPNGGKVKKYQAQPREVFIAGDPWLTKQVSKAVVQVNLADLYESTSLDCPVVLLDRNGQALNLPGVEVKPGTVRLVISLDDAVEEKAVPVVVTINGTAGEGYVLKSALAAPETVTIKGAASRLADIDQVATNPIDISGMQKDQQVSVGLNIPEGITVIEPDNIRVSLIFASREGTVSQKEVPVEISQLSPGLTGRLDQTTVKVKLVPKSNTTYLQASVDATGLGVGKHVVDVHVYSDDGSPVEEVSPQRLTLTIT